MVLRFISFLKNVKSPKHADRKSNSTGGDVELCQEGEIDVADSHALTFSPNRPHYHGRDALLSALGCLDEYSSRIVCCVNRLDKHCGVFWGWKKSR